ncbi:MAG: Ni/Fe-hydrogenase cytochrome b subunit [Chloroflexi bacterium]|nr:MAG: Ni/Fe-hydrogenase cytochrome b subunit [Chloroflexota bacterium]
MTLPWTLWIAIALGVLSPLAIIALARYVVLHGGPRRAGTLAHPDRMALPAIQVSPTVILTRKHLLRLVVACILAAGGASVLLRFAFGLGAVTNLSDRFAWGLWIGFDVMGGVALAAGAFVIAGLAHVFNARRLQPLVRPAILTGFLGYLLVILALIVDLGRPYNIWRPLVHWQHHSVMWEVGMCVASYTTVLFLEFLPVILERVNRFENIARRLPTVPLYRLLRRISIVLVILGIILSTLHQSSLGSLWVLVPEKLYPLWYSIYLPVFFWLSAVAVGFAMTIVESTLSARAFGHGLKPALLADLGKWSAWMLSVYLVARFADIIQRGVWPLLFQANIQAISFWLEMGLGVALPTLIFAIPAWRRSARALFLGAALVVVFGVVLNRLNVSIVGMWPWANVSYLPSIMEVLITLSLVTLGVLAFAIAAKHLPIFEHETESHTT